MMIAPASGQHTRFSIAHRIGQGSVGFDRLGQVDRLGPEAVVVGLAGELPGAVIPRQDVEVHVGVDHHQHQVVDLLVGYGVLQQTLDAVDGGFEVHESRGRKLREGGGLFLADQHQRSEGRLLRPHQHQPFGRLRRQVAWIAELLGGRICHGLSLRVRGRNIGAGPMFGHWDAGPR
jgi:hypothetical protein